jgi:hypothetical protein
MTTGFLLHVGATVLCVHTGQAQPTISNPRVTVSGQPITTQSASYTVAGCPFTVSGASSPCITAQWVTAATRVRAGGGRCCCKTARRSVRPTAPG